MPIWDWEDVADEVKQLAPVWSSKHRHTTERRGERERERDLSRTRVYEKYSTWRDSKEIENKIGSE